jgi:hypothetical protein
VVGGIPANAEENQNFRYGLEGNNLVFSTPEQALAGGSFRLAVKQGQRAKILVELVDVYSTEAGAKRSIPLGSSPFTADGFVTFKTKYPIYEPSEDFQYFDIFYSFRDDIELDRPVLGGLSISLAPESPSEEETVVQSSIVATFAYLPAALNLEGYAPALTLTDPKIDRTEPEVFPLNLLPNFPRLYNHGDLVLSYELTNTGDIFLETTTELNVEQVGIFGQRDKTVFSQSRQAFLVPAQLTQEMIDLVEEQSENQTLDFGLYRVTLTATGQLGDEIGTSAESQQTLVVFPWKQSLIALGLIALFRRRIGRAFSSVFAYGKALREFRYSRDPKPELLPPPEIAPAPNLREPVAPEQTSPISVSRPLVYANSATAKASMPASPEARPLYPFWYEPPKKGGEG